MRPSSLKEKVIGPFRPQGPRRDLAPVALLVAALIGAVGVFLLLQNGKGLGTVKNPVPAFPGKRQHVIGVEPGQRFVVVPRVDPGTAKFPLAISGDIVVWVSARRGPRDSDIVAKNLATGEVFSVCTAPGNQYAPAISGNMIVWVDERHGAANADIYGKNLATGEELPICTDAGRQLHPAISGDVVVWEDARRRGTGPDIVGLDLHTWRRLNGFRWAGRQVDPAISGDIIVWRDFRNEPKRADIIGYSLLRHGGIVVAMVAGDQGDPSISGSIVAWSGTPTACRDLATSRWYVLRAGAGRATNPQVSGTIVVWEDHPSPAGVKSGAFLRPSVDIWARDLSTGQEFPVRQGNVRALWPVISGNIVVWLENGSSIKGMWLKP
jgi:beta propeller repeat protein